MHDGNKVDPCHLKRPLVAQDYKGYMSFYAQLS